MPGYPTQLVLRRYHVDEASLEGLTEEEKDSLMTDRAKISKLLSSFVEVFEFLFGMFLAVAWN